jgi:hypothetical protein
LLAHGRWFSPGTPTSSIIKTGRQDITEILLKVALKHKKPIKINQANVVTWSRLENTKSFYYWNRNLKNFTKQILTSSVVQDIF